VLRPLCERDRLLAHVIVPLVSTDDAAKRVAAVVQYGFDDLDRRADALQARGDGAAQIMECPMLGEVQSRVELPFTEQFIS
jgi:hypothetical protein